MVLLVLTILVTLVAVGSLVAMFVRDDAYLGIVGLMLVTVAAFMAITYGIVNAA